MSKRYWSDAAELSAPRAEGRTDEFGADVAKALATLRARHGISNASCEAEGNSAEELDRLRADLREALPGLNRRGFLRLGGAAAVFALAACGKKHPDTLVPWAQQPEGTTLGNAVYYSSTLRDSGHPVAVMVKTYDGRPIKVEGNPDHPLSRGRCDARTQASLLNLYDPDRLQDGAHQRDGDALKPIAWDDLDQAAAAALAQGGVGLLTGPIDSPAQKRLIAALAAAYGDRFHHAVFEAFPRRAEARARELLFGDATLPHYRADLASVLVSFGDFLGGPQSTLAEQIEFGDLRRLKEAGNGRDLAAGQVIAFEPTLSQLGSCADVRVRVPSHQLALVAWAIAELVAKEVGATLPASAPVDAARAADQGLTFKVNAGEKTPAAFAARRLLDARRAGKHSLVWAGGSNLQGEDAIPLHQAVAVLNDLLGNEGTTVVSGGPEHATLVDDGSAAKLLDAVAAGDVSTLIVWGCNPAFAWPASAEKLKKAKTLIALADRLDETAVLARFIVPTLHGLESWGDAEARPGVYSVQQPCIPPLWNSRAAEESLMAWAAAGGAKPFVADKKPADASARSVVSRVPLWQAVAHGVLPWQEFVRQGWVGAIRKDSGAPADERAFWSAALGAGVVTLAVKSTARAAAGDVAVPAPPAPASGMQLVLSASRMLRDGEQANNAWLQEMPDPVSRICWDGYLAISPVDAAEQGIAANQVVTLTVGSISKKVAVHIQVGQHPGTLELFLGWGRERAGEVATLTSVDLPQANGFELTAARPLPLALSATIAKTGATYQLATPQGHDYMEGREIALDEVQDLRGRERAESELWKNGTDPRAAGISAYGAHHVYPGHKWGMTIDMNTCIGCNACMVACIAENNVPVVGRDEVIKQRAMHWIRIHRYYSGAFDKAAVPPVAVKPKKPEDLLDVEVVHQPMLCQQCDNAPCEPVCPANATMHNNEGISLQVYNRCVGTRYCANNCPYKVRRFNWYEYSAYRAGPHGAGEPMKRIAKNVVKSGATSSQEELTKAPLEMLLNPEVSVRSRGVMEKCNFCVQRTRTIRDREKAENRRIRDGEITTACAQTCPTKAIVFGDISDPQSEAVRLAERVATGYKLLDEELNTRPAVTYLKRVRVRPASADEAAEGAAEKSESMKRGEGG
jgi:molybdopterin-containing oxidoreductase family iron-sulfur binding subunit